MERPWGTRSSMSSQGPSTMIVVTANWEIGDGSIWPASAAGIMGRFRAEVARAAVRAGWRADGRYEPVPRVEIVFAGDTFDWLGSRQWLGATRPWHRGAKARAIRARVVARSLRAGGGIVRGMLALVRRGLLVPKPDRHGRPVSGESRRVPVGLTILEGNLDAGLTREPARMAAERSGIGVGTAWDARGVRVVHGHGADPLWIEDDGPSLGASLRVDLLARFAAADVMLGIDAEARRPLLAMLRSTHPLGLAAAVAAWVASLRDTAKAGPLQEEWLRSVSAWHRAARGSGLTGAGRWNDAPFDVVEALAGRLTANAGRPFALRPPLGAADLLGELLGIAPPPASSGIVVLGHAPIDTPIIPAGHRRCIALGPRQGMACDRDGHPPGVREIFLRPTAPPFPTTALVTDRGDGSRIAALGDAVAEWSFTDRRRGWSAVPVDGGAGIVDAA